MGGKGGGSSSITPPAQQNNPYTDELAKYARNLYNQTEPVRNYFTEDWQKFFRPTEGQAYDPYALPAFKPLYGLARTGVEDQYSTAKQNILSGMPRGGAMANALGNLETGRAKDVGSLQASIAAPLATNIYNQAYGTAWQTSPNQYLTGMGTAGQQLNTSNIAQNQLATAAQLQEAQASRAASTMKGSGVGSALGKGLGSVLGSVVPGVGTALGGMLGGGLGGATEGITSGLGGYSTLMGQAMGGAGGF